MINKEYTWLHGYVIRPNSITSHISRYKTHELNPEQQQGKKFPPPPPVKKKKINMGKQHKRVKNIANVFSYIHKHYFACKSNPHHAIFLTLTYPSSNIDLNNLKRKHLNIFCQLLRRKESIYIWRMEPQENDRPHYHFVILSNEPFYREEIRNKWNDIIRKDGCIDAYTKQFSTLSYGAYVGYRISHDHNKRTSKEYKQAYNYGRKTNWTNPNTIDLDLITKDLDKRSIVSYITKYVIKKNYAVFGHIYGSSRVLAKCSQYKLISNDSLHYNDFKLSGDKKDIFIEDYLGKQKLVAQYIFREKGLTAPFEKLFAVHVEKNLIEHEFKFLPRYRELHNASLAKKAYGGTQDYYKTTLPKYTIKQELRKMKPIVPDPMLRHVYVKSIYELVKEIDIWRDKNEMFKQIHPPVNYLIDRTHDENAFSEIIPERIINAIGNKYMPIFISLKTYKKSYYPVLAEKQFTKHFSVYSYVN
jgi:hypothetical protein